jgi:hypothetical protein
MSAPRNYEQEFRDGAARMFREWLSNPGESKRSARRHVGLLLAGFKHMADNIAGRDGEMLVDPRQCDSRARSVLAAKTSARNGHRHRR